MLAFGGAFSIFGRPSFDLLFLSVTGRTESFFCLRPLNSPVLVAFVLSIGHAGVHLDQTDESFF